MALPLNPHSRLARLKIYKADLQRDLDPSLDLLERQIDGLSSPSVLPFLDDYDLPSNTPKFAHPNWYRLDRSSVAVPDGSNVLATFTGVGRWVKMVLGGGGATNLLANFIFNGAGAVLIPGNYGFLKFASATTIPQFDLYADPAGNLTIDIAQTTAAAFPAGFTTVSTIPLVAAQKLTLIPGTPIPIAANDILRFTVTGPGATHSFGILVTTPG